MSFGRVLAVWLLFTFTSAQQEYEDGHDAFDTGLLSFPSSFHL
jgi:hypothetical protein